MKQIRFIILFLFGLSLFFGCQKDTIAPDLFTDGQVYDRDAVVLPAGSVDQLEQALQSSGTVILAPGVHTENQMVTVTGYAKIIGQPGAVLRIAAPPSLNFSTPVNPGLFLNKASGSVIQNLTIEPLLPLSGTAIRVDFSSKVTIQNCTIKGFQYSVNVYKSPLLSIFNNKIEASTAWQTGQLPVVIGIVISSGDGVVIERNELSGAFFGAAVAGRNSAFRNNIMHNNYIGLALSYFPLGIGVLLDGTPISSDYPANNWNCRKNTSYNNLFAGYLLAAGANHNILVDNNAYGNGRYGIELAGNSNRFGWPMASSHDNTVQSDKYPELLIKNCGQNNIVEGGTMVNTAADPCF